MKNDEEGEPILEEDVNNFEKLSLRIATSSLESQIHTSAENNVSTVFRNFELNENPKTLENKSLTMVSHLNSEIASTLESEKGLGEQEKTESISKLESSYYELQAKLESAEAQHMRDQAEIDSLHSQSRSKVEKLVLIADRIVSIFLNMYGEELPPHSTDEYQFARGLLGIVGNMAGSPEGRQFLIENKNGKSLLRNLVLHLPKIPTPSGVPLKRLLMMIFWNMCVNKSVHCYLFELQIGQVIAHCLDEHNDDEQLQILGLELLLSITYNLTDPRRLDDIFKYVSTEHLRRIVETQRDKVGTLAQTVLDSLRNNNESIALRQNNQRWNE